MAGATAGSFWSGTRAAVTDSVPKLRGNVCLWFPPSSVQTFLVSRWPAKVMQAPGLFHLWPAVPWGWSPRVGAVSRQLCRRGRGACRRILWAVSGRDTCHLIPQSTEQGSGSATCKGGCETGVPGGRGNRQGSLPDLRNKEHKEPTVETGLGV